MMSTEDQPFPRARPKWLFILAILLLAGCGHRATSPVEPNGGRPLTLSDATCFSANVHDDHVDVRVLSPWREAQTSFRYRIVREGQFSKTPDGVRVIAAAPARIVALSTSFLPSLEMLEALDLIVGVANGRDVTNPVVSKRIREGRIVDLGAVHQIRPESIVELKPDVVFAYGISGEDFEALAPLEKAKIPVVAVAEYVEPTPLGRAEWIKFFALFLEKSGKAAEMFGGIKERYEKMAKAASAAPHRPRVLVGNSYRGVWYVPGGKSYMARFLKDAGADYCWKEDSSAGVLSLDFEAVFAKGASADVWINTGFWNKLTDAIADDPRYAHFAPYRSGRVYNNNAKLGDGGGSDFWETGLARPDLVLADLVALFHPELAPGHSFIWYKKLAAQ